MFVNPFVSVRPTNIKIITIAAPAAGAELIQVVPLGRVWRILSFSATLTASSAVATRVPSIVIDDGSSVLLRVPTGGTITASTSALFQAAAIGGTTNGLTGVALSVVPLPEPMFYVVKPGWRVRTLTQLIDVADQWSAAQMVVDELPYSDDV